MSDCNIPNCIPGRVYQREVMCYDKLTNTSVTDQSFCEGTAKPVVTCTCPPRTVSDCLCVFDMDRTLTSRETSDPGCQTSKKIPGARSAGYCFDNLWWSEMAQKINTDPTCKSCKIGVISAGNADGAGQREAFGNLIGDKAKVGLYSSTPWNEAFGHGCQSQSYPGLVGCGDKGIALKNIIEYWRNKGVEFQRVNFYDDRVDHINQVANKAEAGAYGHVDVRAKQVSCPSRDNGGDCQTRHGCSYSGEIGCCGGQANEFNIKNPKEIC